MIFVSSFQVLQIIRFQDIRQNKHMEPIEQIQGVEYSLCGTIGEGAAGKVSLARDKYGKFYAIKKVRNYNDPIIREMVNNQIQIQKKFKGNPHVIQYIAQKYEHKYAYIVLEIGACSLRNVIDHKKIRQKEFLCIVCDMCQGLLSIHERNVIHRDIKPQNIIFKDGIYKITDFGVSCDKPEDDSYTGTLPYMAPEIIFEQTNVFTAKIDVWSMGVTVFQVLFNIHPFFHPKHSDKQDPEKQIKQSINYLTKQGFSVNKFIQYLKKKKMNKQAEQVEKKVKMISKQVIENICLFFERDPTKREDMTTIYSLFLSLKQQIPDIKSKQVKINPKVDKNNIPPQIVMMIRTINIVHKLDVQYKCQFLDRVIFSIELAIWFLTGVTYGNVHYIIPSHLQQLKKHLKPRKQVWQDVKTGVIQYYFWLNENKEDLDFFQNLNELRVLLLMCCSWSSLIEFDTKFCHRIRQITRFQIHNALQLLQFLQMFSDKNYMEIQTMIMYEFCI